MYKYEISYRNQGIGEVPLGFEQSLIFTTTIEEKAESGKLSTMSVEREVEIIYNGRSEGFPKYQVFLYKTEFFYERKAEPNKELLIKLSYVFDELVISTDESGNILRIHNFPFIQYRWSKIREELLLIYSDEVLIPYFLSFDELIADYNKLINYLKTPAIYGLFFNGLRRQYSSDETQENQVEYDEYSDNIKTEETISCQIQNSEKSRLIRLTIKGKPFEGDASIVGECLYLDGVLEKYQKEINTSTKKVIYSAKWIGLKKYFQ